MAAVTSAVIGGIGVASSIKSGRDQKDAARDGIRAQTQAAQDANKLQWDIYQQDRTDNEGARNDGNTSRSMWMQMMGLQPYGMNTGGGAQVQPQPQPGTPPAGYLSGSGVPGSWRDTPIGARMEPGQVGGGGGRLASLLQGGGGGMIGGGLTAGTGGPGQVSGGAPQVGTGGGNPPVASPNPNFQQTMTDLLRATPGYQWNLDQGQRQLDSSAAARGGLYSGKQGIASIQYGQNYADRIYGDHMNRLAAGANMAQTANSQNAQMGMNYANQAGANFNNAANARASGLAAGARATGDMWGNVAGIGGWLAGQYGGGSSSPSTGFAQGFGNNTGWLSGGGFNNTPGGGGFGWLGGGG